MGLILTFPTNPAQSTYDRPRWNELKEIAALCQQTKTFLILDNIYQDTLWQVDEINPEVFAFLDSADFVLKVFGPSKDRPGFSGIRTGYYCGDPRIREAFFYYSSIQYNTPNSSARCLFALDLLFRLLRIQNESFREEHLELLDDYLAGWSRPLNRAKLFERINGTDMFSRYSLKLSETEKRQADSIKFLREVAGQLDSFSEIVNDNIGNIFLVKVNKEYFPGTCHDLFLYLLKEINIGILPANAFGFPIVPGDAWFRFTTIHESATRIAEQLQRVNESIKKFRS